MRKLILLLTAVILMALAGCKSDSVSRVYPADMDTTWAAVLRVSEKMSDQKPSKIDRENGKIITGWIYSNVIVGPGEGASTQRSTDIWRAIVTCKPAESGTKVTVKAQKGYARTEDTPGIGEEQNKTVGVVFGTNDTDPQNKFLDKVTSELAVQ